MKAIVSIQNLASDLVVTGWTPIFIGIFVAIVVYALWPKNQAKFDAASKLPLREE
ncbi:MAG: cbb3-type cytochrome c oxidase subunit 3 [Xanthobacteraceae bacterium]|jgi:cytochrome c oxidase cbb3-type subunit 4